MEILRRVVLLAGFLSGLWLYIVPTPALVRVSFEDFAKSQARQPKWRGNRDLPLDEFIAKETEGRLARVEGAPWRELFDAAEQVAAAAETGAPVEAAWRKRVGRDYSRRSLYFFPHEAPVAELTGEFGRFTFVALGSGASTRYLGVSRADPEMLAGSAPVQMIYPLRRYSGWALLLALIGYMLLPWPKHDERTVYYSRVRASYLPDLIGLLLLSPFFITPLLIVPNMASNGRVLDTEGGCIYITLIFWSLCVFGLAICAAAAWYTRLQVTILDDGLRRDTLWGRQEYRFGDITGVHAGVTQAPKALVRAGWLISLLNWRAAGPTLLMASRSDPVIAVECRDGRGFRLMATALRNVGALVDALDRAGVPVDDPVRQLAAD